MANNENKIRLEDYNEFCKELREGTILYNVNSSNMWGDYLLVVSITRIRVCDVTTYTVLLLGMKKQEGKYIPRGTCISLTPESMEHISFLKHVGYCKFTLIPAISDINVSTGLATVYSQTDLRKFVTNLSIRKPRVHKYGNDGKPIIKKNGN